MIEFLISLSLSAVQSKLHRSTSLLTSWMYVERFLLPWFRALSCVKAAISSAFGLVQSSNVFSRVCRLSFFSSGIVVNYVLASFPAHSVMNFNFVVLSLMCANAVSTRSSVSSLHSLKCLCNSGSSGSIFGPWMKFWLAILIFVWFTLLLTPCNSFMFSEITLWCFVNQSLLCEVIF